ncbi:hypothetical protein ACFPN2_09370 [Steroidobacter flavus]|uniref:Uncharacterized protein n=1 Tax=Steroidobacter flavus TaxID=1842136 RepID=A0ABV8SQN6_9GAMM
MGLEQREGERSAALEIGALFCAIKRHLVDPADPSWLDRWAQNARRSPEPSFIQEIVIKVAESNCDRAALADLIQFYQVLIVQEFFTLHDGASSASTADENLCFRLGYERSASAAPERYKRGVERLRLSPDALHAQFEEFLDDISDAEDVPEDSQ